MKTVAIMQPCFVPYAGYFRLFPATDLFIVYDCVQFPRRGFIHRNKLPSQLSEEKWLTLPILKCRRDTRIKDLAFSTDAKTRMETQILKFPSLEKTNIEGCETRMRLTNFSMQPVDYIVSFLEYICNILGLPFRTKRSSDFHIPSEITGQDRIIEILKLVGATNYVNTPGGKHLYNANTFSENGIDLRFLEPYNGSFWSILHRVLTEQPHEISDEIMRQI